MGILRGMSAHTEYGFPTPDQGHRYWAAVCHAGAIMLVAMGYGGIFVALFAWYFKREGATFIEHHGREAVNFQLSALFAIFLASKLSHGVAGAAIAFLFAPLFTALVVIVSFLGLFAAYKALQGEPYRYPLAIRFL